MPLIHADGEFHMRPGSGPPRGFRRPWANCTTGAPLVSNSGCKPTLCRGVWGHAPPGKFWDFRCSEVHSEAIWGTFMHASRLIFFGIQKHWHGHTTRTSTSIMIQSHYAYSSCFSWSKGINNTVIIRMKSLACETNIDHHCTSYIIALALARATENVVVTWHRMHIN